MINVIHLDTEGGWGGSSISLFKIISSMNKNNFKSIVVCRKKGPIIKKYNSNKIEVEKNYNLYSFSAKPSINNFKLFITTIPQFLFFFSGIRKLFKIIKKNKINVIHLNFEGFFLVGFILKIFLSLPIVVHYRSTIPLDSFAHKIISYIIVKYVANYIIFISKTEKKKFFKIYPNLKKTKNEVIYNISSIKPSKNKLQKIGDLVFIGNLSYWKGVDKLIPLAKKLQDERMNLKIKLYGDTRGEGKFKKKLIEKLNKSKLKNIKLMGRINNPEKIIKNAFLVLRPSRHNDPWGRDVIDACSSGVPIISTGNLNDIIINKYNSFYVKNFNVDRVFYLITELLHNRKMYNFFKKNLIKQSKLILNTKLNINKFQNILASVSKKAI